MHFHRPISVILVKQVSASILSGLCSFFLCHSPHPRLSFIFSYLLPPSLHPPSLFSEGHSLIPLSIDAYPVTLSLKAQPAHIEHPSPYPSILTQVWAKQRSSPPPNQGQGLRQWEALPLHIHMDTPWDVPSLDWLAMRIISELINFIYLMQMRQTWEFAQRS